MFFESKNYHWEKIDETLERALVGYDSSLMLTVVKFKKGEAPKYYGNIPFVSAIM